ncbi:MAG: sulfite reductase [Rhodobacteraceae bacterium]|nr:MAG: sulfite reductase [Paracoccaceae bacterium]
MARAFTPKVITANALIEGDVIYLTFDDQWSRELSQAELITDEAHAQLRLLEAQSQAGEVVGAYLADAIDGPNGPEPTHFREEFRRTGPSNYAHGKQEAEANV